MIYSRIIGCLKRVLIVILLIASGSMIASVDSLKSGAPVVNELTAKSTHA